MRRRSFARQLVYGALVALLVIAAAPVVYLAGREGIAAVRAVDPTTALERGLVALVAACVPVIAIAAYAHWLNVSSRSHAPREAHLAPLAVRLLVAPIVITVVIAGWPIIFYSYRESVEAFAGGSEELAFGIGYGLLGILYVVFAAFCVARYVQWIR